MARQIARVSHSVDWALDLVGESNDLQHYFGTAAAVTLLDDDGDHSIGSAETAAMQLKKLATSRVLEQVRIEGKLRSVLDVVF